MRIQKARIDALEKAIQAAAWKESPIVVFHFEPGVWQVNGEAIGRADYEEIVARYEEAGVPFLLVSSYGVDDEEPKHLAPAFLEGAGVVKGPEPSVEAWEAMSRGVHSALSEVPIVEPKTHSQGADNQVFEGNEGA